MGVCTNCNEEHEIWAEIFDKEKATRLCRSCAKKFGFKK